MLSIFAPHFFNWTEQLKDSGHEIYWLDVFDSNTHVEKIDFVNQIKGWRYKWDYPGRYFLKKNAPHFTNLINRINERSFQVTLENKIEELEPDIVHSFVIYLSAAPALKIMENHPEIKWVLSTWGSDLFYYRGQQPHLTDIQKVLPKIDYLFTDCKRDQKIAKEYGFQGKFLGVFPGGGGYDLKLISVHIKEYKNRDVILIKGYKGLHGRCIEILKALTKLKKELKGFRIIVFGAVKEVFEFTRNSEIGSWSNFSIKGKISHIEVMKLMGMAKIAIGNSLSDGMPNTLLEAIIMEAFPVQSNPGGVSAEIIEDGKNGILLKEPENIPYLTEKIEDVLSGKLDLQKAIKFNTKVIKPLLSREKIKKEVLDCYKLVEKEVKTIG